MLLVFLNGRTELTMTSRCKYPCLPSLLLFKQGSVESFNCCTVFELIFVGIN